MSIMARPWTCAAWAAVLLIGCGGQPVGSKVPKADPTKVAIGAAAAATLLTLADPNLAGKPEGEGEDPEKKVKKSKESVPSGVLDRLDADAKERPCEGDADAASANDAETESAKSGLDLVPRVENELPPKRPRCEDDDDGDRPGAAPAATPDPP